MWILKEIKSNNRKRVWRTILVLLIIISWATYFYYTKTSVKKENFKVFEVKKWSIESTVAADWKVEYKEQYDLNFPISGTLAKVFKKEWDEVKKWDIIASLDDTYLKINIDKANIALETAVANLNAKLATKGQKEDINVSEKQLELSKTQLETNLRQAEKDLETAKSNLNISIADLDSAKKTLITITDQEKLNIENAYSKADTEWDYAYPAIESYLRDSDLLLWITEINKTANDQIEVYLWSKDPITKVNAESSYNKASDTLKTFIASWNIYKSNPKNELLLNALDDLEKAEKEISTNMQDIVKMLNFSNSSQVFTQATIDSYVQKFTWYQTNTESLRQRLLSARQSIVNSENTLNTKTINQNSIITSSESKLASSKVALATAETKLENIKATSNSQVEISAANLDLKKSWFDKRELDPYKAAIDNAKKWIEEAKKKLEDSKIVSPISWKIWKMSITKIWTIISINPNVPFVTLINKDSLFVSAKIEEWDISKVKLWQKVHLTFNSLEWVKIDWEIRSWYKLNCNL